MTPDHDQHEEAAGGPAGPRGTAARRGAALKAGHRSLIPAYALLGFSIVVFTISLTTLIHRLVVRSDEAAVQPPRATRQLHGGDAAVSHPPAAGAGPSRARARDHGVADDDSGATSDGESVVEGAAAPPRPGAAVGDEVEQDPPPGTLRLRSMPRAEAYLDGHAVGLTPLTLELRPGARAQLVFVASGREIYRETVRTSRQGAVEVVARLKPARYPRYNGSRRGVLKVLCRAGDPRRIFLNRRDSGYSCPKVAYYLRPGRYRVGLHHPVNGHTATQRVRVRARKTTVLRPPYDPKKKAPSRR